MAAGRHQAPEPDDGAGNGTIGDGGIPEIGDTDDVRETLRSVSRALLGSVEKVNGRTADLEKLIRAQQADLRKQRRRTYGLGASLLLGVVLAGWLAVSFGDISDNQSKLQQLQSQLSAQEQLSKTNQCAMVDMFLVYANQTQQSQNLLTPAQQTARATGYAVIKKVHDSLGC
jgi:hypothetical protein